MDPEGARALSIRWQRTEEPLKAAQPQPIVSISDLAAVFVLLSLIFGGVIGLLVSVGVSQFTQPFTTRAQIYLGVAAGLGISVVLVAITLTWDHLNRHRE